MKKWTPHIVFFFQAKYNCARQEHHETEPVRTVLCLRFWSRGADHKFSQSRLSARQSRLWKNNSLCVLANRAGIQPATLLTYHPAGNKPHSTRRLVTTSQGKRGEKQQQRCSPWWQGSRAAVCCCCYECQTDPCCHFVLRVSLLVCSRLGNGEESVLLVFHFPWHVRPFRRERRKKSCVSAALSNN